MSLPPAYSATAAPQLSDSVYELYKPGVESLLDVVFFHGLQLSHTYVAHLSTWRSRGSQKEVWPMTWLPEEFPGARILSVKYDACIITSAEHGRLDLYCTAESLMQDLISAKVGQHPWRPVILVGHSYGGLVIKQLCLHAHLSQSLHLSKEQMAGFLNCVKGIFFYGTPHHGMSSFLSPNGAHLKDASPLVDYVKLLCAESARLHQNFDALRLSYKWSIAGVGESRPTTFLIIEAGSKNVVAVSSEMVVDEASARYGDFTVELEDHVSLCQPESRTSNTYLRLTAFIQSIDFNKVKRRRLLDNFQTVPKMAMSLHSHLFVEVQNILRTAPAVGLCGMGGIGKTTLAKLLFNELCAEFEYTCFVPGFMLKGDYQELERGVYSLMHHHGTQIAGTGKNKKWKSTALRMKTLLLVLEDIDNDNHIELLQNISSVNDCANSRYIVTSRDRDILNSSGARVFDVKLLNQKSSKELFMSYAFPYPTQPSPSLTEWVDKIVVKCDGLPLTLEVMGKYLQRKVSESIWKQCLDALDEADNVIRLDERLWAKLRVSYDRLGSQEKEIFLDAASFFNNSRWSLREAKSSWRVLYGLEDLRWQTLEVLALRLEDSMSLNSRNICQMKKLQYLDSEKEMVLDAEGGKLPKNLVLLRWRGEVDSFHDLVDRGLAGRLAVLDLKLPRLQTLIIDDVDKLQRLPEGFGNLSQLQSLLISYGQSMSELPECFGRLARLRDLLLDHMFSLQALPDSFGQLPQLSHLTMVACRIIRDLPESFGHLANLTVLHIRDCRSLEALPNSFGALRSLQYLRVSDCFALTDLPSSFGQLTSLQDLIIEVPHFTSVPDSIRQLPSLQRMVLTLPYLETPCSWLPSMDNLDKYNIYRVLFGQPSSSALVHFKTVFSVENGVFHFKECDTSVHVYTTLQSVNLQYGPSGIFSDQPVQ
ncbi:hypothetical protein AXG93_1976s1540 [Marchantia polymorpha subsp. ruderalis]|uniref:Uncharacterized protein n=1 Tax=Marchantia polymorpha subsp. ruderalis TaxID=1480154 RepID=A0A176VED9_MARPO|nr:hypothetical protein AXG93_1976s1540 [Marchantia polymorpha subsp. ruderalis]